MQPQNDRSTEINLDKLAEIKAEEQQKPQKKHHIAIWLISALISLVIIAYGCIAVYFQTHFFLHTWINGIDCSGQEIYPIAETIDGEVDNFSLDVIGRDAKAPEKHVVLGTLSAQEIDLHYVDTLSGVQYLMEQQNVFLWPLCLSNETWSYSLVQDVAYDEELTERMLKSWSAFQEDNMTSSKNAYIGTYIDSADEYELVAETLGTELDVEAAIASVKEALSSLSMENHVINLDELGCYRVADITSNDKVLQKNIQMANKWVSTCIIYDWNGENIVVDGDVISAWITMEDNTPKLDEEAVKEFVAQAAKDNDTYGKKRSFVTSQGVELILPSGAYGWKADRQGETEELIRLIYQGTSVSREPLYISKGAAKGENDIGTSYVEADLTNQHLYLYQDGQVILETDFVSGKMTDISSVTPPGVFGLTYKTQNAVLRGENYETPVSYWMPFNGNIGMHDATWRSDFGKEIYLTSGSHGCINLPLKMAAEIYNYVSTGFPVICYYY